MRRPDGLGPRGRSLWDSIAKGLPAGWRLDDREVQILRLACRQADDVAALEREIKKNGPMSVGSTGQTVVNPAVTEARQGRLAINRMLGELELPDADEKPASAATKRARRAADTRWAEAARKREARRGQAV